jgi:hypothetical protein
LEIIADFINSNKMRFLGFEASATTLRAYHRCFPNDPAATNLEQWAFFETENPEIFSSMYNFWVQNAAAMP